MNNELKDELCPVCEKTFQYNEPLEIVYCPECGRPVHRDCWNDECPDKALHGDGYVWEPTKRQESEAAAHTVQTDAAGETGESPLDGFRNNGAEGEDGAAAPFNHVSWEEYSRMTDEERQQLRVRWFLAARKPELFEDPDKPMYMGVTAREISSFCNAYTEKGVFRTLSMKAMAQTNRKVRFNLLSGLLVPYYQFYQGMYGLGVIALLVEMLSILPVIVFSLRPDMAARGNVSSLLMLLSYLGPVFSLLMFFFGERLYFNWSIRKIKNLRKKYAGQPVQEYAEKLRRAGSCSFMRGVAAFLLEIILFFVIALLVPRT